MKEKLIRFMQGRYGVDQLSKFLLILGLIAVVVSSVFVDNIAGFIFYILGWILVIYCYFRVFSRNVQKRYAENQKFLNARYEWTVKAERRKKRFAQRKQYKFFKCPMCKQDVRVPRGHGKICITCPKCREQFVRRS